MVGLMMLSENKYWGTKTGETCIFRDKTKTWPASWFLLFIQLFKMNPLHEEDFLWSFYSTGWWKIIRCLWYPKFNYCAHQTRTTGVHPKLVESNYKLIGSPYTGC